MKPRIKADNADDLRAQLAAAAADPPAPSEALLISLLADIVERTCVRPAVVQYATDEQPKAA